RAGAPTSPGTTLRSSVAPAHIVHGDVKERDRPALEPDDPPASGRLLHAPPTSPTVRPCKVSFHPGASNRIARPQKSSRPKAVTFGRGTSSRGPGRRGEPGRVRDPSPTHPTASA